MDGTNGVQQTLSAIDAATLTPLVRCALDSQSVEVTEWHFERVHGGGGDTYETGTTGIYRFVGTAHSGHGQGSLHSWSLIFKAFDASTGHENPAHCHYWKREPLFYQSGLLIDLSIGLTIPTCYCVVEPNSRECWVWLQDIPDRLGGAWPIARYGLAGRHFGQFNGTYLVERTIPDYRWLSSGRLGHWLDLSAPQFLELPGTLDQPLVRRWLPGDSAERTLRLWQNRRSLLDMLGKLPRTLCHHEAHRRNLIAHQDGRGQDQTVAIDWPVMGVGAIGQDLASLVAGTVTMGEVDVDHLSELEREVFEGYVAGLFDVGWRGNRNIVRLGYALATALGMALSHIWWKLPSLTDEDTRKETEAVVGQSIEDQVESWAELQDFLLDLAEEGLELAGHVL